MANKHFLLTALSLALVQAALMGCGMAVAAPSRPAADTWAVGLQPTDRINSPIPSGVQKVEKDNEDDSAYEPRIIEGNDRVYAPLKAGPPVSGGDPVSLKFEEAPLVEVVRTILGDMLKLDYTLHPPIKGSVTLSTTRPIAADQAVFLLETALQANGYAIARDARGTYHVGSLDAIRSIAPALREAHPGLGIKLPPGTGPIIVPLQYIGANEMASILRSFAPDGAIVRVDTVRNLLVLAGNRSQAEGWLDVVSTFDINLLAGMSVGVFPLRYITVQEVQEALALVTGSGGASSSGAANAARPGAQQPAGRPGVPAAAAARAAAAAAAARAAATAGGSAQASGGAMDISAFLGAVRIMPMERLNSILVITPRAAYLEEARRWIEKLDRPNANDTESQLFIYPVQNGNAAHLSSLIGNVFGGSSSGISGGTGVAPGLTSTSNNSTLGANRNNTGMNSGLSSGIGGSNNSGMGRTLGAGNNSLGQSQNAASQVAAFNIGDNLRVIADSLNNSILVYGSRRDYAKIEAALKQLDISPVQVLIEASIIEVTLSDALKYGLQWAFKNSYDNQNYNGWGQLTENSAGGKLSDAATQGFSYVLSMGGSVRGTLNMLASDSLLKVISSPSLMVMDNHEASILVGQQTPINNSSWNTSGEILTNSTTYKDTGVQLNVLPSVNAGDMVTLRLKQIVSEVGEIDKVSNQYSYLQREIDTQVAVRSGETLVLGGLIRDRATEGDSGIPILKDIPLLGKLFGSTTKEGDRNELLVIITPRVVRSDEHIRQISSELRNRLKGLDHIKDDDLPAYLPAKLPDENPAQTP